MSKLKTREHWLNEVIDKHLLSYFSHTHANVLSRRCGGQSLTDIRHKIKVSCGFPAGVRGSKSNKAIGVCWGEGASTAGNIEIFISPTIEDSSRVIDILIHELIHAILPEGEGHGKNFRACAKRLNLTGKMTATVASDVLLYDIQKMLKDVGEYPHAKMQMSNHKKQTTRMIKHECINCGAIWRMSRKYIPQCCPNCAADYDE